jgi:uncharacterized protein YkwD
MLGSLALLTLLAVASHAQQQTVSLLCTPSSNAPNQALIDVQTGCTNMMNYYRGLSGCPNLAQNATIAAVAINWANYLAQPGVALAHNANRGSNIGENIFMSSYVGTPNCTCIIFHLNICFKCCILGEKKCF